MGNPKANNLSAMPGDQVSLKERKMAEDKKTNTGIDQAKSERLLKL